MQIMLNFKTKYESGIQQFIQILKVKETYQLIKIVLICKFISVNSTQYFVN